MELFALFLNPQKYVLLTRFSNLTRFQKRRSVEKKRYVEDLPNATLRQWTEALTFVPLRVNLCYIARFDSMVRKFALYRRSESNNDPSAHHI